MIVLPLNRPMVAIEKNDMCGKKFCLRCLVCMLVVSCGAVARAQQTSEEAILAFTGAADFSELDQEEFERLSDYLVRPLRINYASQHALLESGLLDSFQAASLADYRSRHGDILSFAELAAVDGFGEHFVTQLRPFVRLDGLLPEENRRKTSTEIKTRTALKPTYQGELRWSAGLNVNLKHRIVQTHLAFSKALTERAPSLSSISGGMAFTLPRSSLRFFIGDFNARFGQGLVLWTGMGMGGISSTASLRKNTTGLSASSSFTGMYSLSGVASDCVLGPFKLSLGLALPGIRTLRASPEDFALMPVADLSLNLHCGQLSLTSYYHWNKDAKTSFSQRWCTGGVDIFSEIAFDWLNKSPAALAGVAGNPAGWLRLAGMVRYYSSDFSPDRSAAVRSLTKCTNEHSVSLAADFFFGKSLTLRGSEGFGSSQKRHTGSFSVDFGYFPVSKSAEDKMSRQLKMQLLWHALINDAFSLRIRMSERLRTWGLPSRTQIRLDGMFQSLPWVAIMRMESVLCRSYGLLGYLEGGYRNSLLSVYARMGLFMVDNWDDRIYVYERDAPGQFNAPAMYGRGVWAAMTMAWKFARWAAVYIRAGTTAYPFMTGEKKKPGTAELKLQLNMRF